MKFNKWTLGLAAVGAVSMASAVRADEAKLSQVNTALSNTTISGYVSTSMNWQITPAPEPGDSDSPVIPLQNGKANGFNLDVVKVTIAKPEDAQAWASGYQVDLLFGPDAVGWNPSSNAQGGQNVGGTSADFAIQQAYVSLNTPVGNGIDWKVGVWNTVIGYESFDAGSNPNYTRSWGWAVEPTEHTGILGAYKVTDELSFNAGVANTLMAGINTRDTNNNGNESWNGWHKTWMGSVTFTAPSSWGWAAGSGLYAGIVYGFGNAAGGTAVSGGNQVNYYAGATLNTPCKAWTAGVAFDYVQNVGGSQLNGTSHLDDYILGVYSTYKLSDKLSVSGRGEYFQDDLTGGNGNYKTQGVAVTGTLQYDLWANVISRLELRWDRYLSGDSTGTFVSPNGFFIESEEHYQVGLYANIIYKF